MLNGSRTPERNLPKICVPHGYLRREISCRITRARHHLCIGHKTLPAAHDVAVRASRRRDLFRFQYDVPGIVAKKERVTPGIDKFLMSLIRPENASESRFLSKSAASKSGAD